MRPPTLSAISVQTYMRKASYEIAAEFRRRKVLVVLGGFHVSAVPDEAAQHADAVVIGQAEDLWPRLLEDASHGRLQRVYGSRSNHRFRDFTTPATSSEESATFATIWLNSGEAAHILAAFVR